MKIASIKPISMPFDGWLKKRFGDCYAQISTDTKLRVKSSIRDVHRVEHGRVDVDVEILLKKIPIPPQGIDDYDFVFGYEDSAKKLVKGIIETDPALKEYVKKYPKEWDVVTKCLGLTRQRSRHPCAFLISDEPIQNFIPTVTISGVRCTQYTAPSVEAAGGLKMDFLVVNSLNDIAQCIKLIQKRFPTPESTLIQGRKVPGIRLVNHNGQLVDIWDLPEDQNVFRDICSGNTETVFQFNTPSARGWLKDFMKEGKHALRSIEDLAAFTALDRPGPLDANVTDGNISRNMLQEFAARARGERPIGNNAFLDKALKETHGVIVYQEQLQRIFQEVGKTTGIQANSFRDDIGKKRMAKVMKWKEVFMPGAIETLGPEEAQRLWDMMETFGQYGFNMSHSICYVVIGYACAFLKYHYPLEWWTSVLSNADRNEIEEKFWGHCGHMIDPPDLVNSGADFRIIANRIKAPFWLLNGVGPQAHAELVAAKPISCLEDLLKKVEQHKNETAKVDPETGKKRRGHSGLNKTVLAKLVVSGTADSLFPADMSYYDKINALKEAFVSVTGKKTTKKDKEFYDKLSQLSPVQRFQMQKSIVPSLKADLTELVKRKYELPDFIKEKNGSLYATVDRPFGQNQDTEFRCLSGEEVEQISSGIIDLAVPLKIACIAYVHSATIFKKGRMKAPACEIAFEVDGHRFTFVKWSDKNGLNIPPDLAGAVVAISLSKFTEGRDLSIDDIEVIQPPLDLKPEESS